MGKNMNTLEYVTTVKVSSLTMKGISMTPSEICKKVLEKESNAL